MVLFDAPNLVKKNWGTGSRPVLRTRQVFFERFPWVLPWQSFGVTLSAFTTFDPLTSQNLDALFKKGKA